MIEHLVKIRRDGNRVDEHMDALAQLALGWRPDKITRIEWDADGASHARNFAHGVLATVARDESAIVLLEEGMEGSILLVINADGSTRHEIANTHPVDGDVLTGNFGWFEPARNSSEHAIGVIFQAQGWAGPEQYQFDLDLDTGEVFQARISR